MGIFGKIIDAAVTFIVTQLATVIGEITYEMLKDIYMYIKEEMSKGKTMKEILQSYISKNKNQEPKLKEVSVYGKSKTKCTF